MSEYLSIKKIQSQPRLPLQGEIDLTWRCNNACRHCWISLPADAAEKEQELSFDEIRRIADEARSLGCRQWNITGGEPLLRPDFPEIFEYLTSQAVTYSLNTNGTLITPATARQLKRKGNKMVALYGATAEVYDYVARRQGAFEQAMQGFAYLKEAGVAFTVQLVPMRANRRQWDAMVKLAERLSPQWRVGASWLYMSASGSAERNAEIRAQRLEPRDTVLLDPPDVSFADRTEAARSDNAVSTGCGISARNDNRLFAGCIESRREFHVDAYGGASFCCFIKDPAMRYNLRRGTLREAWEEFIPSLADKVRGDPEYMNNCGACRKTNCNWCGAYAFLEHGHYNSPIPYLCDTARAESKYMDDWKKNHRRYYRVAGISVQIDSDLPITDLTFEPKFRKFQADGPQEDSISIHYHFSPPFLNGRDMGEKVYDRQPWAIYRKDHSWIYKTVESNGNSHLPSKFVVANNDHTRIHIYHPDKEDYLSRSLSSLTFALTDQALLARVLADRKGCYLHSAGVILNGKGLLFVGHSDAGKSTIVKMLRGQAEILCDDRNIVRRWPDGFKVHGCWNHGEVPDISSSSAPLHAIFFHQKSPRNRLHRIEDPKLTLRPLLACLIRPFMTADWWEKMLTLLDSMSKEIPCYNLEFDRSGALCGLLQEFTE
ncbi:MAG: radical SAM protein [Acidobacteria bacterium]|nr:radical SAM protein [Acidobacteriota bacterium]